MWSWKISRASQSCLRVAMRPLSTPCGMPALESRDLMEIADSPGPLGLGIAAGRLPKMIALAGVEPARWSLPADGPCGEGSHQEPRREAAIGVEQGRTRTKSNSDMGFICSTSLFWTYCQSKCSVLFYLLYNHFLYLLAHMFYKHTYTSSWNYTCYYPQGK